MNSAKTITATFNTVSKLTVAKNGTGSGTVTSSPAGISCGSTCSASFAGGTSVTLTAAAASGSTFAGWSGCDSQSGATCTVNLSSDKSVTATFIAIPPPSVKINSAKISATRRTATFKFTGSGGAGRLRFKCRLDKAVFKACASPKSYTKLKHGKHSFAVEAIDSRGTTSRRATRSFSI